MPNPELLNSIAQVKPQAPLAAECTCPEDCRFDHEND